MQIRQKMAPEEPRMDPKWMQNREKGVQMTKMAQDGAHERLPSMIGHPFSDFLGPPWEAKNHQKSTFSQKSRPRERFFIDFCCERRFPRFFDRFLVDFG